MCHVQKFQFHRNACLRAPLCIQCTDVDRACFIGITRQLIQRPGNIHPVRYLLHPSVRCFGKRKPRVCIQPAVHQHGAGCGQVKPSGIRSRHGFAGSEEMPLSVREKFYPCVIIIRVRPERYIHLPRRNPDTSHGIHAENRLLPAAAVSALIEGKRGYGPVIIAVVCPVFGTPLIDRQCRLKLRKILCSRTDPLLEQAAARPDFFRIHPMEQYIFSEKAVRKIPYLLLFIAQCRSRPGVIQKCFQGNLRCIAQGHPGIQKNKCFSYILFQHLKSGFVRERNIREVRSSLFKAFFHFTKKIFRKKHGENYPFLSSALLAMRIFSSSARQSVNSEISPFPMLTSGLRYFILPSIKVLADM